LLETDKFDVNDGVLNALKGQAAQNGHVAVVRLLLETGNVDNGVVKDALRHVADRQGYG
jgi:hypothetical protein